MLEKLQDQISELVAKNEDQNFEIAELNRALEAASFERIAENDSVWMEGVLRAALDKFGEDVQIKKAVEEMAELIVELHHLDRSPSAIDLVVQEIADVEIMMAQMRLIFGSKRIDDAKKTKILRLQNRIRLG